MNDSKIVLIGNGPSVLDHKFGRLIDSFETVVRFSWYHINGHEEYVGTKTDIWFTTCADLRRMKTGGYREVYEHSWQWDPDKDKNYKNLTAYFPNAKKTKRDTIIEMQQYVDDTEYFCYSTGAIAAFLFSKQYGEVTLYGFDWWESREKHHYGDNQTRGGIHKPDKEFKLFCKLAKDGRITDLNPLSKILEIA